MAKFYGDLPCAKLGRKVHITVNSQKCLCGQEWVYDQPYADKRTNIIWREIEAVTCPKCRASFEAKHVDEEVLSLSAPEEKEHCGDKGKPLFDEVFFPELRLCSRQECEPPYGGKEACEFYENGICTASGVRKNSEPASGG